ncbi:hypothetical protein CP09DC79_1133, partial [Chlamydia psittaci 09DC79]
AVCGFLTPGNNSAFTPSLLDKGEDAKKSVKTKTWKQV